MADGKPSPSGESDSSSESQATAEAPDATLTVGALESATAQLANYLLLEPFVAEKDVLDIAPNLCHGAERLRRAGAHSAVIADAPDQRLSAGDESFDLVIAFDVLGRLSGAGDLDRLLEDIKRVLAPDGFCVLRIGDPRCGLHPAKRFCLSRDTFANIIGKHFAGVSVMTQIPLFGFIFDAAETEDLAVNESLVPPGADPSFHIAFATNAEQPGYHLNETLLAPFARPTANKPPAPVRAGIDAERFRSLQRQHDLLREETMTLQDENDRLRQTVAALQRDAQRYLREISEQAAALEMAGLDGPDKPETA